MTRLSAGAALRASAVDRKLSSSSVPCRRFLEPSVCTEAFRFGAMVLLGQEVGSIQICPLGAGLLLLLGLHSPISKTAHCTSEMQVQAWSRSVLPTLELGSSWLEVFPEVAEKVKAGSPHPLWGSSLSRTFPPPVSHLAKLPG